jgi:hypothetical protein
MYDIIIVYCSVADRKAGKSDANVKWLINVLNFFEFERQCFWFSGEVKKKGLFVPSPVYKRRLQFSGRYYQ